MRRGQHPLRMDQRAAIAVTGYVLKGSGERIALGDEASADDPDADFAYILLGRCRTEQSGSSDKRGGQCEAVERPGLCPVLRELRLHVVFSPNTERCRMGKADGPLLDGPPCRRVVAQHLERRPPGLPLHVPTRLRRRHARTRSFASQEETWQNDVAIRQYAAAGCRALLHPRARSSAHFGAPCCACEALSREARGLPVRGCSTLASVQAGCGAMRRRATPSTVVAPKSGVRRLAAPEGPRHRAISTARRHRAPVRLLPCESVEVLAGLR